MSLVIARGTFIGNMGGTPCGGCDKTALSVILSGIKVGADYAYGVVSYFYLSQLAPFANPTGLALKTSNNATFLAGPGDMNLTHQWAMNQIGGQFVNPWGYNCFKPTGDYGSVIVEVQDSGYSAGGPRIVAMDRTAEIPVNLSPSDFIVWSADVDANTLWTLIVDGDVIVNGGAFTDSGPYIGGVGVKYAIIKAENAGKTTELGVAFQAVDNA